ncbi:hypothetical protein ACFT8W_03710 [Streptomyces hygroscopicus]|uniref:hypothetical protein n=1 Tax=Streptomyces hygroscopicus TaxID=1912 RepID=UPI003636AFC2
MAFSVAACRHLVPQYSPGRPVCCGSRLPVGEDSPVRVVAFAVDDPTVACADGAQATLRLLDHVRLQCEARYGRHACVVVDNVVHALLPDASADGGPQRQLVEDIITRQATHALRMSVRAGLGSAVRGLAYVPAHATMPIMS